VRGMCAPPRAAGEEGQSSWQCIEFVLSKEALTYSRGESHSISCTSATYASETGY
jgi:hypothetical protein